MNKIKYFGENFLRIHTNGGVICSGCGEWITMDYEVRFMYVSKPDAPHILKCIGVPLESIPYACIWHASCYHLEQIAPHV